MKNMFATLNQLSVLDLTRLTAFGNFYLDPANGSDYRDGKTLGTSLDTLAAAYAKLTTGKNETIFLVGDGTTAATARQDATLTWAKSQTNLIGVCSPTLFSQRARIAPTGSTTAFANFIILSGSGNLFQNLQIVHDFDTDTNSQIALNISGHRNVFKNCHIYGIAKGSDAGGRCIYFNGGSENLFEDCVIGVDTIDRSAANAAIEFASGSTRNVFRRCIFPMRMTATSPLVIKVAAAAGSDRFQLFEDCVFINHGTSTMAGMSTLAASIGGFIAFVRPSLLGPITGFGTDATSRGQIYITGPTDGSTVSGKGYNPNA